MCRITDGNASNLHWVVQSTQTTKRTAPVWRNPCSSTGARWILDNVQGPIPNPWPGLTKPTQARWRACFFGNSRRLRLSGFQAAFRRTMASRRPSSWRSTHGGSTEPSGRRVSTLASHVVRPVVHEPAPSFEQVRALVGGLDRVAHLVRLMSVLPSRPTRLGRRCGRTGNRIGSGSAGGKALR